MFSFLIVCRSSPSALLFVHPPRSRLSLCTPTILSLSLVRPLFLIGEPRVSSFHLSDCDTTYFDRYSIFFSSPLLFLLRDRPSEYSWATSSVHTRSRRNLRKTRFPKIALSAPSPREFRYVWSSDNPRGPAAVVFGLPHLPVRSQPLRASLVNKPVPRPLRLIDLEEAVHV